MKPTHILIEVPDSLPVEQPEVAFKVGKWAEHIRREFDTTCPACGGKVNGEGLFATGVKMEDGYQPKVDELLKTFYMECNDPQCGWNQYS